MRGLLARRVKLEYDLTLRHEALDKLVQSITPADAKPLLNLATEDEDD